MTSGVFGNLNPKRHKRRDSILTVAETPMAEAVAAIVFVDDTGTVSAARSGALSALNRG